MLDSNIQLKLENHWRGGLSVALRAAGNLRFKLFSRIYSHAYFQNCQWFKKTLILHSELYLLELSSDVFNHTYENADQNYCFNFAFSSVLFRDTMAPSLLMDR